MLDDPNVSIEEIIAWEERQAFGLQGLIRNPWGEEGYLFKKMAGSSISCEWFKLGPGQDELLLRGILSKLYLSKEKVSVEEASKLTEQARDMAQPKKE